MRYTRPVARVKRKHIAFPPQLLNAVSDVAGPFELKRQNNSFHRELPRNVVCDRNRDRKLVRVFIGRKRRLKVVRETICATELVSPERIMAAAY